MRPINRYRLAAGLTLPVLALLVAAFLRAGEGSLRDDAARILAYLADDARGGRGSFTSGNREAARFIAAEFGSAGLAPVDSVAGFIRPFAVRRVAPESLSVVLDGIQVPDSERFILTELSAGSWALSDSFPVRAMGETFDREFPDKGPGVVLVPRVHKKMFERYHRFASRARIDDGDPQPGAVVAVLTDAAGAGSASVTYRGRVDAPELENVVGVIPGKRGDEIVLIAAHYDHLGTVRPVGQDSIANGADDNASGSTALVLLARHFAGSGTPERTLVFAALAAEEIGGFGARRLLSEMSPDGIVAMVNLEMLGKESKFGPRTFWITGFDRSTFGPIVSEALQGSGFTAHPDPYPEERLFYRSDNAVFARAGVPAHTVSTTRIDVDTVYHTVEDEIDRIDTRHLADIVRGISIGVGGIVGGSKTPSRIPVD